MRFKFRVVAESAGACSARGGLESNVSRMLAISHRIARSALNVRVRPRGRLAHSEPIACVKSSAIRLAQAWRSVRVGRQGEHYGIKFYILENIIDSESILYRIVIKYYDLSRLFSLLRTEM